ncbi:uncharacterized protein N7459_006812 [Penicillium hispanicum]|uniref:uncharacterized protein n=1 Tax=Penicillium hispanicum TaxID=1080232 RepID=UPI0025412C09|nr:uncharacterized protein N7459_006812 [Penicillium hispanicum]KAJ5577848.1 hypothetical protein N7459_006812 [Penicillium hispanicum]
MSGIDWVDKSQPLHGVGALVAAAVSLAAVQIIFAAARFYTRYLQRMKCGVDDYVILIALSFFALEILDLPFTITPAKISLLLFYVRIFYKRHFRVCAYIVGSLVLGVGITVLFESIFQCSPISYGWNPTVSDGSCLDQTSFYRAIWPFNVLTGLLIWVLPMPYVWSLHAPKGQKMALTGVFLLGGLGTIASILRLPVYYLASEASLNDVAPGQITSMLIDGIKGFSVKLGIFSVVESAVIIIATCLVSIWPLLTRLAPRRLLAALSCSSPRKPQHRCWYMAATQAQPGSHDGFVNRGNNLVHREGIWSSEPCSLADLEDRRLWALDEDDVESRNCEERVIISSPKF